MCLGSIPVKWSNALSKTMVTLSGVYSFGTYAVDPVNQIAYGLYFASAKGGLGKYGVASVDLRTGKINVIKDLSVQSAGVSWMAVSDPWLAWVEGDSQTNLGDWSIHIWNRLTLEVAQIATSQLPDGSYLSGQLTFPVVGHGYVAWSQPASTTSLELRVYQFDSHTSQVLDTGRLSSPVLAGPYLAWAKSSANGSDAVFRVVDAATLSSMDTPGLLSTPRPIRYLAGSSDYLAWTEDSSTLVAMKIRGQSLRKYQIVSDGRHELQFPAIAGRLLIWWSGTVSTVLDLDTGNAFDVVNGVASGAGDLLIVSGAKGNVPILSTLQLSPDIGIAKCVA